MEELTNYLNGLPSMGDLEVKGFLGTDIAPHVGSINRFPPFIGKRIHVLAKPDYPKKTVYFLLQELDENLLSDDIHLFALYITQKNNIIMCCSFDSFLTYNWSDDDFSIKTIYKQKDEI